MKKYDRPPVEVVSELVKRFEEDQKLRQIWEENLNDQKIIAKVRKMDRGNTEFLKRFINKYGWPKITHVGTETANAAWLLAQHTADDRFMKYCLTQMLEDSREVEPHNLARTIDRVRIAEGKLQYYGTHFQQKANGKYQVMPIEDPGHVETRRKAMGLPTIEEKTKEYNQ